MQEGNIGLMEAVERYDYRRGVRFATYAGWWIKKSILQAVSSQGPAIDVPPWVNDQLRHLRSARARLETHLQRSPRLGELAHAVFLAMHDAHPAIERRIPLTAELLERAGWPHTIVRAPRDAGPLAAALWLVQYGDLLSVHLAARHGVDPTPIPDLEWLKARLASAAGADTPPSG